MELFLMIGVVITIIGVIRVIINSKNAKNTYTVAQANNYQKRRSSGGWSMIVFGMIWCIMIVISMMDYGAIETSLPIKKLLKINIFPLILSLIFIIIGCNDGIIKPTKRKRQIMNYRSVIGRVVDFRVYRSGGKRRYKAIYEFYYNGNTIRMNSSISLRFAHRRSDVNIMVNEVTGDMYCPEDEKIARKSGIIMMIMGVFFFIACLLM